MTDDAIPAASELKRDALGQALQERFGMSEEDATEIATVVVDQFAEQAEVNDENLEPTVRSIFYTLEAKKILSFRREEYTWEDGQKRRGFWWRLRTEELEKKAVTVPIASEEDVYAQLPKDAWSARQHA